MKIVSKTLAYLLVSTGAAIAGNLPGAEAAAITYDEKGNVVVTAYDENMRFVEGEAGSIRFSFLKSKCDPKTRPSLSDVVNSKDVMTCVTNDETAVADPQARPAPEVLVRLPVATVSSNRIFAPGVYRTPAVELAEPLLVSGETPTLTVMFHVQVRSLRCNSQPATVDDDLGYQRREISTQPASLQFTLAASRRKGEFSLPLCISCNPLSAYSTHPDPRWLCGTSELSSDGRALVSFRWLTPDIPKPRKDWEAFDAFARNVAKQLFVNRTDDFQ